MGTAETPEQGTEHLSAQDAAMWQPHQSNIFTSININMALSLLVLGIYV